MDEIEEAINGAKDNASQAGSSGAEQKPTEEEARITQARKDLAELEAAKVAASAELQRIRVDKRAAKKAPIEEPPKPEKVVIDEGDPSSQAWLERIQSTVTPVQEELEKEKAEIRQFALDEFLNSRPNLAKSPEKLKELMSVYDRLHTATERNKEGVLLDLDKAYAAIYHKELMEAAQFRKVNEARNSALFSDPAVSRGSTAYQTPREAPVELSAEEQSILSKWGMSSADWQKMKVEQDKKAAEAV